MSGIAPDERPVKLDVDEVNEIGDGLVLYQGPERRVHYFNRTASLVYELCTGEHSVEQIAEAIADSFGLAEAPRREVEACLETLRAQGVVR